MICKCCGMDGFTRKEMKHCDDCRGDVCGDCFQSLSRPDFETTDGACDRHFKAASLRLDKQINDERRSFVVFGF